MEELDGISQTSSNRVLLNRRPLLKILTNQVIFQHFATWGFAPPRRFGWGPILIDKLERLLAISPATIWRDWRRW